MTNSVGNSAPLPGAGKSIVPTMSYRNATAMVDWLSDAYGLEQRRIVTSPGGAFLHAQLAYGDSIVLIVAVENPRLEGVLVHPDGVGGAETQACYLVVPDIDAHFARATAKGAQIVSGLDGTDSSDRYYVSRDPEGHIWMFGTFDPRAGRQLSASEVRQRRAGGLRKPFLSAALAAALAFIAAGLWTYYGRPGGLGTSARPVLAEGRDVRQEAQGGVAVMHGPNELLQAQAAREKMERELSQTRAALEAALRGEKEARSSLALELRAKEGLAQKARSAEERLAQERAAREAAERKARDAADQLGRAQLAQATAERAAKDMADKLDRERNARALAEQSVQRAAAELARERSAKAAAELAASELRAQLMAPGGGAASQGLLALRDQLDAERRTRELYERTAKDAQLQLAQERFSRDATERALKQVQDRLEQTQDRLAAASCWACPSGAPCSKPN
jgi:uncharacterized glyoxalase superfamily protein PhnB